MNVKEIVENRCIALNLVSSSRNEWAGPCPFCGGNPKTSDRFHVWPDQKDGAGSYWCRKCEKAGDNIQLRMDLDGLSFPDAAKAEGREIGSYTHRPVAVSKPEKPAFSPTQPVPPPDLWKEKAAKLIDWAHGQLLKSTTWMRYLANRGIDEKAVTEHRLGFNPGHNGKDLFRPRESWGLGTEIKPDGKKKKLWLPKGLVIPQFAPDGTPSLLQIRTVDAKMKYYYVKGSTEPPEMMVIHPHGRALVIIESRLDAIATGAATWDDIAVVGLGSAKIKPDPRTFDIASSALVIMNALDFDTDGKNAHEWWSAQFPRTKRYPVPQGKDPGEAYQAGVNLSEWIAAGLPPVFRITRKAASVEPTPVPVEKRAEPDPVGPSGRDVETGGAGNFSTSVRKLAELLKTAPVRLRNAKTGWTYQENARWAADNPALSRQINRLMFTDPDCVAHLCRHRARVIDGRNILNAG